MTETGSASYFYAITRPVEPTALEEVVGVGSAPVRLVTDGDLAAVVSTVDLAEFGEDGLRRNLEDLRWLEGVARAHDAVVRAASAAAPTAPLRLATICLTDAAVRERLREIAEAAGRALDRITGRVEWSVKVVVPAASAAGPASAAGSASAGGPGRDAGPDDVGSAPAARGGAGTAYLERRRQETRQREVDVARAGAIADDVHSELSTAAAAGRRLPPQDQRLAGYDGTMVLNGAYLVGVDDGEAFAALVAAAAAARPDVRIDVGGPWPPYSFATLEDQ